MVVFALLFGVFLVTRRDDPATFASSRTELNQTFGAVNLLVLLTSSLLVVLATQAFRRGSRAASGRLLAGAAGCGVLFLVIKAVEYAGKVHHGIDPGTNDFFMYFFILTGIHAVHVAMGIAGLIVLRHVARRDVAKPNDLRTIEIGATFWHMVDLLWVVLFPLLYLAS
jgi:nitric oxide reductase NorE protein